MATTAAAPPYAAAPDAAHAATRPRWAELTAMAVAFASVCVVVGVEWDISWHMTIGRDTFWTPAHLAIYTGGIVSGLACGALVLWTTFAGTAEARAAGVGVWGFRGPLGAWIAIWGAIAMITSAPFDNWWHDAYGLDVQILSPPHSLLLAGIVAIQFGAMVLMVSLQNRAEAASRARLGWLFALTAGLVIQTASIAIYEHASRPNSMHGTKFYLVTAGVFPLFLAAAGRATALRWPATAAALVYTVGRLALVWALPLFEGRPLLAPIYNPVERFVAPPFPLLLLAPALVFDLLLQRLGDRRDWTLAALAGVAFPLALAAVSWPFAEFMLTEAARGWPFHADEWAYSARLGPWRYEFWDVARLPDGRWDALAFAKGLGWAALLGVASTRLGLWWGNGMRRVVR